MNGIERIKTERTRQIEQKGFGTNHDRHHTDFELLAAAMQYAFEAQGIGCKLRTITGEVSYHHPDLHKRYLPVWPWKDYPFKPLINKDPAGQITTQDAIRMLEKSGALIAAEIDRLLSLEEEVKAKDQQLFNKIKCQVNLIVQRPTPERLGNWEGNAVFADDESFQESVVRGFDKYETNSVQGLYENGLVYGTILVRRVSVKERKIMFIGSGMLVGV